MNEEIFEKVASLIAVHNNVAVTEVTMDSTFEQLHMDSLDALALVNDLEEEFNIAIPNAEAIRIRTVRQAVENLEKLLLVQ